MTVVSGLQHTPATYKDLLKALQTACGTGGTVKDGVIEIQGDHVDTVLASLAALGYTVKRSGG